MSKQWLRVAPLALLLALGGCPGGGDECPDPVDCNLAACAAEPECQGNDEICNNNADDDGDGDTDCDDADCATAANCQPQADGEACDVGTDCEGALCLD